MAEGTVQLPADGSGSKLRTEVVTVGANSVHQEVVTLADSGGHLGAGVVSSGASLVNPVNAIGDTTVYTPAAGKAVRLKWVGLSTPDTNGANVTVKWRFGVGSYFWHWTLGKPAGFAHNGIREGAADASLILNCDAAQPVTVAFDLEEF